jgi:uncharacterized protein (TIGR02145 family)
MKQPSLLLISLLFFASTGFSQTVKIGKQVWTTENLDVVRFRNGDLIPEANTSAAWKKAGDTKQPAWCYYNNVAANGVKYAKLYNWYAVNDPRGLAPAGYHIPSDAEWTLLTKYLGEPLAAKNMKSTSGWEQGGNGTNSSGFTGLPGGYRVHYGQSYYIVRNGGWWSSSASNELSAWSRYLVYDDDSVFRGNDEREKGLSVRCLKD